MPVNRTLRRTRRLEHQVLAVFWSIPIFRPVFCRNCPSTQISPPVRKAFPTSLGRLVGGRDLLDIFLILLFLFFIDLHINSSFPELYSCESVYGSSCSAMLKHYRVCNAGNALAFIEADFGQQCTGGEKKQYPFPFSADQSGQNICS